MKQKIIITRFSDGKQIEELTRAKILRFLYTPYTEAYIDYSILFRNALKKYKNVPLKEHILTESEKRRITKNPDAIMDIPRYEVKGFDSFVGDAFEQQSRDEFYERFMDGDSEIVEFINNTNEKFSAVLKEE